MRRTREQSRFRFAKDADPSWCASVIRHADRRVRPTRTVTIGAHTFRVCAECARPWESIRGARVARLEEAASA